MRIVYKIQDTGQASDLRFVSENYIAETNEVIIDSDVLPDIETLHSQAYLSTKKLSNIRAQRNALLAECDWTQALDTALTPEKQEEWAIYRQTLRYLPAACCIDDPVWPEKPA